MVGEEKKAEEQDATEGRLKRPGPENPTPCWKLGSAFDACVDLPPKSTLLMGAGSQRCIDDKKPSHSTAVVLVPKSRMQASEGSKKMDRAISKMNGRDCGGRGWVGVLML